MIYRTIDIMTGVEPQVSTPDDCPFALAEGSGAHTGVVEWTTGVPPSPRPLLPGYDDGVTAIVAGMFILLAVSVSRHTIYLKTFASALLSGRRRQNTFDDHTVAESRITAALLLVCCLCEGILIYFGATTFGSYSGAPFIPILLASAVAIGLMTFQTAGYALTGYAFAPRRGDTSQWLRGFFASQSLLGLVLTLPALLLLFYPGATTGILILSAALYIIARLMFIVKGFRFFYTNFFSLFYFILYLCTLEIVPILIVYRIGLYSSTFQ